MDILSYVMGMNAAKGSGGSSGGGGSSGLPAGIYTQALDVNVKQNYYFQKWFYFNDELYVASTPYTGGGNDVIIYKLVDGAWTEHIAKNSYNAELFSPTAWNMTEYNGKLHIVTGLDKSNVRRYCFDGTTITRCNALPGKGYYSKFVVHNNILKYYSYGDGYVYALDEATDTWTQEAQLSTSTNTVGMLYVTENNELYGQSGKTLYKYENGGFTSVRTLNYECYNSYGNIGDWIFFQVYGCPYKVQAVNLKTGEEVYLGRNVCYSGLTWIENGEMRHTFAVNGSTNTIYAKSHIVFPTE